MNSYYVKNIKKLNLTNEDWKLIAEINKINGQINGLFINNHFILPKSISRNNIAKSTIMTSSIENIITTKAFQKNLNIDTIAETDNEMIVVSQYKLQNFILNSFNEIDITKENISNLHNMLFKERKGVRPGEYVGSAKIISSANDKPVHIGSTSFNVSEDISNLILDFHITNNQEHPLLTSIVFVSEFLSIHPFIDGNGRLSRSLFFLLLLQNQYDFIRVESIDEYIYNNKEMYYEVLQYRSNDWNNNIFSVDSNIPLIRFLLKGILECSQKAFEVMKKLNNKRGGMSISEHVDEVISKYESWFSKSELKSILQTSVEDSYLSRILSSKVNEGKLETKGKLKGTMYKMVKK